MARHIWCVKVQSIGSRLLKGSGASGAGLVVRLAEQLFLVPILLAMWPVKLYGEWVLLSAVPAYLVLSDLGFITAGSNELARRASQEDEKSVFDFYKRYTSLCNAGTVILLVAAGLAALLLLADSILHLSEMSAMDAAIVFFLLIVGSIISQNSISLLAGLRTRARYHQGLYIRSIGAALRLACSFIVVGLLGGGPVALASVFAGGRLAEFLAEYWLVSHVGLPPAWKLDANSDIPVKKFVVMGLEYMLMPVAQAMVLQGFVVLVGMKLGAVAVAVFSTHRTLTRTASGVLQVFSNPLTAEMGLLQKASDLPALRRVIGLLSRITLWLAFCLAVGFEVMGGWIFSVWTKGRVQFDSTLCAILLAATIAEAMWRIPAAIRLGTNRHRPLVWGYIVLSTLGIVAAALTASQFGLVGVAWSSFGIDAALCVLTICVTLPLIDQPIWRYLTSLVVPPAPELFRLVKAKMNG